MTADRRKFLGDGQIDVFVGPAQRFLDEVAALNKKLGLTAAPGKELSLTASGATQAIRNALLLRADYDPGPATSALCHALAGIAYQYPQPLAAIGEMAQSILYYTAEMKADSNSQPSPEKSCESSN